MAIERRRPLPIGRYWVDVFEKDRANWEAWRNSFVGSDWASIEHSESFEANDGGEAREFIIFRTTKPLVWPDDVMRFGVNVAGPDIQSSADTVQKPADPVSPIDRLSEGVDSLFKTMSYVVGGVVVAVGAVALLSLLKKGKRS